MEKNPKAFPSQPVGIEGQKGMSLLDYFAGQSLVLYTRVAGEGDPEKIAEKCYLLAEAMLNERIKHQ